MSASRPTIVAPATALGRAAVSVVRISGPCAFEVAARLGASVPPDRRMYLRQLHDPHSGARLDQALVVGFAAGASFTGEATVEFHLHGSPAVTGAVLRALSRDPVLTAAEPGGFTRQALENGQLTLPQVEALADLIDAETEAQRLQALDGLSGALAQAAERWRAQLLDARALTEAGIDFADEGIEDDTVAKARQTLTQVRAAISEALSGADAATQVRTGFTVALTGAPNVGKSSLVNALARRDVALVSDIPGTTRDIVEARCEIGGQLVTVLDTAGLRDGGDTVERMGIARARDRGAAADLRVHVTAPGMALVRDGYRPGDIVVANKADLGTAEGLAVSALTGQGIDTLVESIAVAVAERAAGAGLVAHARQHQALRVAYEALDIAPEADPEIVAEHTRIAMQALDSLMGRIDVEEVLGAIFSRFCIGK